MIITFLCRLLIATEVILLLISTGHAERITNKRAIRIIIGEAANQGLKGMICVAEVLRRWASPKGFYGYKSNHIDDQPKCVWEMAAIAWEQSVYTNYTHGADHFDNIRKFGRPWWVKYCVKTYEYKDHTFYKEAQHRHCHRTLRG